MTDLRTPLARARGLGSAREGVKHWWAQRLTAIALIPLVLAPGEPGKEILHPVAVAIVGGLVSSTLLDLVVTPAVFFLIGRRAAEKALRLDAPAAR